VARTCAARNSAVPLGLLLEAPAVSPDLVPARAALDREERVCTL
jgi:hypothetical protein